MKHRFMHLLCRLSSQEQVGRWRTNMTMIEMMGAARHSAALAPGLRQCFSKLQRLGRHAEQMTRASAGGQLECLPKLNHVASRIRLSCIFDPSWSFSFRSPLSIMSNVVRSSMLCDVDWADIYQHIKIWLLCLDA